MLLDIPNFASNNLEVFKIPAIVFFNNVDAILVESSLDREEVVVDAMEEEMDGLLLAVFLPMTDVAVEVRAEGYAEEPVESACASR